MDRLGRRNGKRPRLGAAALALTTVLSVALSACSGAEEPAPAAPAPPAAAPTATAAARPTPAPAPAATPVPSPSPTPAPVATTTPTPTRTATPTPTPPPTATPAPRPTATPTPVPCPQSPPAERPASQPRQLRARTGEALTLDALQLFGVATASSFRWEQVFAQADGLAYLTSHRATLGNVTAGAATFSAASPGNYRIGLTADGARRFEVDVLVTKDYGRKLAVKGIEFPDVFGRLGGPEFDVAPKEPRCFAAIMEHALQGPARVGANLVGIVPAVFYKQISPTPLFAPWENDLSLTDDAYYKALVGALKAKGFKVMHAEQPSVGFYGTPEEWGQLDRLMNNSATWWKAWFDEWEKWIVPRAARAQARSVDLFILSNWTDRSFRPDVYPDYARRWRELIAKVRAVYKGQVAIALSNHFQAGFTFMDAVDVVIVGSFSGWQQNMDANGRRVVADPNDPKLEELIEAYRRTFAQSREALAGKARVYYTLGAVSADGQRSSEDTEVIPSIKPDFREQALYYEALFNALSEEPWIEGVILSRFDWFDQYKRPQKEIYWDETRGSSPRSKPAEEIMRLWFGML